MTAVDIVTPPELTHRVAPGLCRAVQSALDDGVDGISIHLDDVKGLDAVGLAAIVQSVRRARTRGTSLSLHVSPFLHRAFIDAQVAEDVEPAYLVAVSGTPRRTIEVQPAASPLVAVEARAALRAPTWDELALFETWAREPLLEHMVGSELLYRSRHLGAYHPDVVNSVLTDPTAITLLIVPRESAAAPIGYLRFYGVRLSRFAFFETAITDRRYLRRGLGVDATSLFLAWGFDVFEVRRIEAKVYAYNSVSCNAMRRRGFHEDGRLREARVVGDQAWDIAIFSVLHSEMLVQRPWERFPFMGFWDEPERGGVLDATQGLC